MLILELIHYTPFIQLLLQSYRIESWLMSKEKNVNYNSGWLFLYWDEPIFSNPNTKDNADTRSLPKGNKT